MFPFIPLQISNMQKKKATVFRMFLSGEASSLPEIVTSEGITVSECVKMTV